MAIRTILYGYQIKNGKTIINDEEAEIVKRVFSLYIEGETFESIASKLTKENIIYFQENTKWNKNTVNRMIENEKYLGNEIYPMIISTTVFNKVKSIKEKKSCKQKSHSPNVELLRGITVCGVCGNRYKRINTWGSKEKWLCSKGCTCMTYIDDNLLEKTVDNNINMVKRNSKLLDVVADSQYLPTINVTKKENEILRLLEQPKLDFVSIAKNILESAEARFDCCNFDNSELTEELKDELSIISMAEKNDYKIIKEYIKQVIIQPDGRIVTVFINDAKIINGGTQNAG